MIKITFDADNVFCECGHLRKDHNSWGSQCYRVRHMKERRRNPLTNKYETHQTHYQCCCKEFVKDGNSVKEKKI